MALDRSRWRAAQRAELAEARARSDAMTVSERMEEAVALYLLTVAEIARRSKDDDEMVAALSKQEALPSLSSRWRALQGR